VLCVTGNPSQYTGLVHAAFSEHTVAAGGSFGACGGGDALPTRPVQVQGDPCVCVCVCVCAYLCVFVFVCVTYSTSAYAPDLSRSSLTGVEGTEVKTGSSHSTALFIWPSLSVLYLALALPLTDSPCLGLPGFSSLSACVCLTSYPALSLARLGGLK
jgi:hypothetical protein